MDCVTGSPMADTYVRQVFLIDDGVKCPRDTQQETASPGGDRCRSGAIRRQRQCAVGREASASVMGASPLRCGPLIRSLGYPRVRT